MQRQTMLQVLRRIQLRYRDRLLLLALSNTRIRGTTLPLSVALSVLRFPSLFHELKIAGLPRSRFQNRLFMFGGSTNYIQQNYTVYSNGTMSVRDGSGNHFSFNLVGVQALSGTLVTSFLSNSSYAVLNYVVSSATQQLSNVSIIFSSTTQFCKPSGLEIKIVGSENWGISNIGTISFVFGSKPSSVMNNTAWFNNAFPISAQNSTLPVSPVSLGFNWN